MQNINLMWGNALLLFLVVVEALLIKLFTKEKLPYKELITNLNSGHILLWIFRGMEVSAYFYTYKYASLGLVTLLPNWAVWLSAFVLWDFCFYWLHRTHHYFSWLWGVHVVHHEGEHFSLSLGIRNSWYSSLTSFPFFIGLAVLGVPVAVFVLVSSAHYFIQFLNHNHLVKSADGWFAHIFVSTSHHRVHHGKNAPYIDKNFGGCFSCWDRWFGSFQAELPQVPVQFGVADSNPSKNPISMNNKPFLQLFNRDFSVKNATKPLPTVPEYWLVSGAILLFIMLLCYVYVELTWASLPKLLLFSIVFLGTIANGVLCDGKAWGLVAWLVATVVLPLVFGACYPFLFMQFGVAFALLMLHGACMAGWFYTKRTAAGA